MTVSSQSTEPAWQRLHFASVLVNLVPRAFRVIRATWFLLIPLFFAQEGGYTEIFDLSIILFFFILTVGSTVRHWLTLRYRVANGRLEIVRGILYRQVRAIDPARIQNVELVRNVFHKVSGLVEVRIETASGNDVEGELSALRVSEAEALVAELERLRRRSAVAQDEEPDVLIENDVLDLVRYGATTTRFGAIIVLAGLGLDSLTSLDPSNVDQVEGMFSRGAIAAGVIALVTGAWLVGIVTAVVRFFRFRLLQRGDQLVAENGLLTRRQVELPLSKVQTVTVSEPLLRRMAGFGSVLIETAAANAGGGGTQRAESVIPVVDQEHMASIVRMVVPSMDVDPWVTPLRRPHPKALIRGLIQGGWQSGLLAAGLSWWFWPWGLTSIVLVPVALWFALLNYRVQGWMISEKMVIARWGFWHRRSVVLSRDKLQSVRLIQGIILRRWGLGRLQVRAAGSAVSLPIMAWDEAIQLLTDLTVPPPVPVHPPTPDPAQVEDHESRPTMPEAEAETEVASPRPDPMEPASEATDPAAEAPRTLQSPSSSAPE